MRRLATWFVIATLLYAAPCRAEPLEQGKPKEGPPGITLTSPEFSDGGAIPKERTCDGGDTSPAIAWSAPPEKTKTIALICDDPDAPRGTWVHWVVFNLPADTRSLPAGIPPQEKIDSPGGNQGLNDFGKIGYRGPCPPGGTHRYNFRLYALDSDLSLHYGATKDQLLKAMEGHILTYGQLVGRYSHEGQ